MGELIAFKLRKNGVRSRPSPVQAGAILFFTGVRRERLKDAAAPSKRVRRRGAKQAAEKSANPAADRANDARR